MGKSLLELFKEDYKKFRGIIYDDEAWEKVIHF